jgi:signal transduction histidine kinase
VHIDDGCGGIPEDDLPHVFEPGYRGDRTRRAGRRGVGLAIARGIAEASGATVSADNVDGGCRFSVRFPAETQSPSAARAYDGRGCRPTAADYMFLT